MAVVTQDPDEAHRSPVELAVLGDPAAICAALADGGRCARRPPARRWQRPEPPAPPADGEPLRAGHVLAALAERLPARRDPRRGDAVEPPRAARAHRRHRAARLRQRDGHARLRAPRRDRPAHGAPGPPVLDRRRRRLDRCTRSRRCGARPATSAGVLFIVLANGGYAIMDRLAERNGSAGPWPQIEASTSARWPARRAATRSASTTHDELLDAARPRARDARRPRTPLLLEVVVAPGRRRSTPSRCSWPRGPRASAAPRPRARPTRGPGGSTTTRSHSEASSSMSVEQISTGAPAAAVERISACISALAPTSTPRVGSSSRTTEGCGVQPLGEHDLLLVAARQRPGGLIDRAAADPQTGDVLARPRAAARPSARAGRRPPARPSGSGRCSPRSACRASARAAGGRRSPARRRSASRAAARSAPARPSGSTTRARVGTPQPADELEHGVMAGARDAREADDLAAAAPRGERLERAVHRRVAQLEPAAADVVADRFGDRLLQLRRRAGRPSPRDRRASRRRSPARSAPRAARALISTLPSRSTVTSSHSAITSSRMCETNTTPTWRSRSTRSASSSSSVLCAPSAEVGSSRISTRGSVSIALAISISWRSASVSSSSRVRSGTSSPSSREHRAARLRGHLARDDERPALDLAHRDTGSRARRGPRTGSAPARRPRRRCARPRRWWRTAPRSPSSRSVAGVRRDARRRRSSPASTCPAPFSPSSACTEPARTVKSAPASATTPP